MARRLVEFVSPQHQHCPNGQHGQSHPRFVIHLTTLPHLRNLRNLRNLRINSIPKHQSCPMFTAIPCHFIFSVDNSSGAARLVP